MTSKAMEKEGEENVYKDILNKLEEIGTIVTEGHKKEEITSVQSKSLFYHITSIQKVVTDVKEKSEKKDTIAKAGELISSIKEKKKDLTEEQLAAIEKILTE